MEGSVLARIAAIVFVAIAITAALVEMGRDEAGQAVRPAALPMPEADPLRAEQRRCQELGEARAVEAASAGYRPSDPQIAWHLARFIEEVRGLPADPIVVRQNWLRAYDFTTDRGALALNDHARANDPFTRVGEDQVSVEVSSVIRASPDSFRVAWSERHYENGQLARTERWTAILTIVIDPPRTAERLRANPLGIYVNAISWSREMSQ